MTQTHRLLYVVGSLSGDGLERQLWYLLRAMAREIYRPGVAVWYYEPGATYVSRLKDLGVAVYPIERGGGVLCRTVRLRRLVRRIRPEVVHSYSFQTNFPAWYSTRGLPAIVVGSLRNDYRSTRKQHGLIRGTLSSMFPGLLIANSRCAQQEALAHRGWTAPRHVDFIPNAIDLDRFSVAPMPQGKRFELLGVGRLTRQKNWEGMLQVLAVFDKRALGPWRFRLCGTGPCAERLQRQCNVLSLSDKVQFVGYTHSIQQFLASSHVLVSASRWEGTPNAVLEGLASGRPVVGTAVGDVPRLVEDGQQGHLVPPKHVELMAERLLTLASNREMVIRMGRAGRERAEKEGGPASLVTKTLAIYRQAGWVD